MVSDTIFRVFRAAIRRKMVSDTIYFRKNEGALKAPFNCLPQLLSRRAGGTLVSTSGGRWKFR
jgi:hypothetical protein